MRAIQPGEQVTISYTDLLQTLDERQQSLLQRYAFICCCERCLDDSPTPGDWFLDAVAADGESLYWDNDSALGIILPYAVARGGGGVVCGGGKAGRRGGGG